MIIEKDLEKSTSLLDYQLQSNIAKLLARENITVIHSDVPTACFDLKNRVMRLPLWKDFGKVVYDMLISHEVGHALFDDYGIIEEYLDGKGIPAGLNVIDDIRIERKVQDKYPSLPKIFLAAYKTLVEKDLFEISGKDVSQFGFLDRLNLHAKIGHLIDIPLDDKETDFFNRCYAAETTQDVIDLYEEYKEIEKEKPKEKEGEKSDNGQPSDKEESGSEDGSGSPDNEETDDSGDNSEESASSNDSSTDPEETGDCVPEESLNSSDESEEVESHDSNGENPSAEDSTEHLEEVSETMDSFEKNVSQDFNHLDESQIQTLIPSKSKFDQATNSYKKIIENRLSSTRFSFDRETSQFQADFLKYKKNMKKKVGVLIREFERRKAAFRYTRSSESRVGTIDVNKMHKYRYDDQIFNTVTTLADGKNHGMIFYIDYSASMAGVLKHVIDQTLNLVYFCKRMSIPFEVYSYTDFYGTNYESFPNEIDISRLVLNNILSSSMSKSDFNLGFEQLYYQYRNGVYYASTGTLEKLGGTPLNSVILGANHHCNDFQKKHRVDKLNVIILSDGDSQAALTNSGKRAGIAIFEGKKVDLSRKRVLSGGGYRRGTLCTFRDMQQEAALQLLRKKATVIGMFLPSTQGSAKAKMGLAEDKFDTVVKMYQKKGFVCLPEGCGGYDSLMILPSNLEIEDETFDHFDSDGKDIKDDRSEQTRLAKEFSKVHGRNKQSRVILTRFAELIA